MEREGRCLEIEGHQEEEKESQKYGSGCIENH